MAIVAMHLGAVVILEVYVELLKEVRNGDECFIADVREHKSGAA